MSRDDIIRMAREARLPACHASHPVALGRFAALVAAAEREACAKCFDDGDYMMYRSEVAAAIRARGQA